MINSDVQTSREVDIRIMSLADAEALENEQAKASDWYSIYFYFEVIGELMRVRVPAFQTNAEGVKLRSPKTNRLLLRDPVEVALNVWASCGADEYTLVSVQRGPRVITTAARIGEAVKLRQQIEAMAA